MSIATDLTASSETQGRLVGARGNKSGKEMKRRRFTSKAAWVSEDDLTANGARKKIGCHSEILHVCASTNYFFISTKFPILLGLVYQFITGILSFSVVTVLRFILV